MFVSDRLGFARVLWYGEKYGLGESDRWWVVAREEELEAKEPGKDEMEVGGLGGGWRGVKGWCCKRGAKIMVVG